MKYQTTTATVSLLLSLFLSSTIRAADLNSVMIKEAWVREAPPNALEYAHSKKTMVHAEVRKGMGAGHDMQHDHHMPSHDNHKENMMDMDDTKMHHDADHKTDSHQHKH